MSEPFLPDVSGTMRTLMAFGLVAGMAAHVIGRMVGRRGRDRLPSQLLGIAVVGVFAVVLLVAKPEWGAAGFRFIAETVIDPLLPQIPAPAAPTAQARHR